MVADGRHEWEKTKEMREAGSIWQVSVKVLEMCSGDVMIMWSCAYVCVCEIQASGARVQQRGGLTRFLSWFERHAPKTAPPDHRSLHKALGVNPNQCQSISPIWLLKCRKISIKPRVKMSTDRGKDTLWRFLKIAPYLQFHCSIDKSQIES